LKTIMILMDSLNRHYLNCYGETWVQTPNIDRLAERGIVFDNHFAGSLPCMPARRDIITGRLSFLETPWSPLQPFDECLVRELRKQRGTYSHMITDHFHYFEWNGMGYHTGFDTWEFLRGQEGDHWHPRVQDPVIPMYRGKNRRQDWVNRAAMNLERDEDYPTPQSFMRGIDFLKHNYEQDNWHLHLEVFDPHEPFVCPQKYVDLYKDTWHDKYHFDWPNYGPVDPEHEGEEAIAHIRKCYAGTLTMADVWLGKFLDTMDELDLWKDTTVILTTDHGHLLGDNGYWAKNYMFDYAKLAHIPLIVYSPVAANKGQRVKALTTTIDLMPTFMEVHGAIPSPNVQGKSLVHLLNEDQLHHDAVLYGYFGKDINLTDGRYTYCRQPIEGSIVHHHTAVPVGAMSDPESYANAEMGRFLKRTQMPMYRIPVQSRRHHNATGLPLLYDLLTDPEQQSPIHNKQIEENMESKMKELLVRYESPDSQYIRMGLS
jgi:arylsulfatase A-like enzyme